MKKLLYENLFSMYAHCCEIAGRRGWHERSAGALSVRLNSATLIQIETALDFSSGYVKLPVALPYLSKDFILISGKNVHLEEISRYPEDLSGIVQISPDGASYRIVMGFGTDPAIAPDKGYKKFMEPDEDLFLHLLLHEKYKKKKTSEYSVVYHGHPTNLSALSYVLPLEEDDFSDILRTSSPQCADVLHKGLGIVDELVMDHKERGLRTLEKMKDRDAVLCAFCGIVTAGYDLMDVIGFVDALDKAAEIRLKILSAGGSLQEPHIAGGAGL